MLPRPMLLRPGVLPSGDGWAFELKRDGLLKLVRVLGKLLCRLGFHRWVVAVTDGERYLECSRCGAYGGEPPTPWKYPD